MNLPNFYASKNYKYLAIIPLLLIVISLGLIFFKGVPQGVDLRGGTLLTVQVAGNVDIHAVQLSVEKIATVSSIRSFASPSGTGIEIELENSKQLTGLEDKVKALQVQDSTLHELDVNASIATDEQEIRALTQRQNELNTVVLVAANNVLQQLSERYVGSDGHEAVKKAVEVYGTKQDDYRNDVINSVKLVADVKGFSFREVGPALSKFFLNKSQEILLISFILAALTVFIVFRSFVPSVAVIIGAMSDIVVTLGAMSLFNLPISLASIAGLLMLIGFSLDTDVMLTMRVLKRKEGTAAERAHGAFKTGLLMNLTSIGAFSVLALAGLYLQIPAYFELGIVATIGSIVDFAATWGLNAVLVLMYAEKKEARV